MNFTNLSTVVEELSRLISGARVTRVFENARKDILLVLRSDTDRILLLSPDRSVPGLHLVTKKPASRGALGPFTLHLKSRVAGGRIERIGLLNGDRIVQVLFSRHGTASELIFEVMGQASNLVITDASGTIRSVYYPDSLAGRKTRPLFPGLRYVLPAKKAFRSDSMDAGFHPGVSGTQVQEAANRLAETMYDQALSQRLLAVSRSELRSLARRMLARTERKLEALQNDLHAAEQSEQYKRAGDMILRNLKLLRTGLNSACLAGYDGKTQEVPLDPRRSPSGNADLYFKRYKKAKTGLKMISQRLEEAGNEASFLKEVLSRVEAAESEQDIHSCGSLLQARGFMYSAAPKKRTSIPSAPFRRMTFRGWEILVGKSAAGNDYITTRLSKPDDLWFHAEGMPGSHVLIRNPESKEVPPELIERAASLAAFYSKGRGAGKVSVTFAFARFVKKQRGAAPGTVTLSERRTIMAIPSGDLDSE